MARLARRFAVAALSLIATTACSSSAGGGTGPGPIEAPLPSCDGARARAEELYAAAAAARTPPAAPTEVADNVAMVVADCRADPARVADCAARAVTVEVLESTCLIAIDDQGSEGDRFRAR